MAKKKSSNPEQSPDITPESSEVESSEVVPESGDLLPASRKTPEVKHFRGAFIGVASRMTAAGFGNAEVATALGVSEDKLRAWKEKYPPMKQACDEGRLHAERQLVVKGLRAAGGYTLKSTKIKIVKDSDGKESVTTETSSKHMPADPTLLVFFLTNMCRKRACDDWLPAKGIEITSKTLNLGMIPPNATKALENLAAAFENEEIETERKQIDAREIKPDEGDKVTPVQ